MDENEQEDEPQFLPVRTEVLIRATIIRVRVLRDGSITYRAAIDTGLRSMVITITDDVIYDTLP